jgi:phosphoribosylamine---glycine ligase
LRRTADLEGHSLHAGAQVQMLRLEEDIADVCLKVARGNLGDTKLNWLKEPACVVIAVDGYADDFAKGQEVVIDPIDDPAVIVFHAGTIPRGARWCTWPTA